MEEKKIKKKHLSKDASLIMKYISLAAVLVFLYVIWYVLLKTT